MVWGRDIFPSLLTLFVFSVSVLNLMKKMFAYTLKVGFLWVIKYHTPIWLKFWRYKLKNMMVLLFMIKTILFSSFCSHQSIQNSCPLLLEHNFWISILSFPFSKTCFFPHCLSLLMKMMIRVITEAELSPVYEPIYIGEIIFLGKWIYLETYEQ